MSSISAAHHRMFRHVRTLAAVLAFTLPSVAIAQQPRVIRVGVTAGPHAEVLDAVKK